MDDSILQREIIEKSKEIWVRNYSDKHGYVSEKLKVLRSLEDSDWLYAMGMFDQDNQRKLINSLSVEATSYILSELPPGFATMI